MEHSPDISVIMPALNEAPNIQKAIENAVSAFERAGVSGEIVVINDGSTDGTQVRTQELAQKYPFIHIVCHTVPQGIGASFWEGVKIAHGKIVTMLPGDGENDGYEILRYLPMMEHVDVVVPYVYNRNRRSIQRRILSKLYKAIINLSFGMLLNYMNGTVMYRKRVLETITLKSTGFFFQTELLIKCIRKGYLYAEVPCAIRSRGNGLSKALSAGSLMAVIRGYVSMIFAVYFSGAVKKEHPTGTVTQTRYRLLEW